MARQHNGSIIFRYIPLKDKISAA